MPKNDEWAVVIDEEELERQIARGKSLYDDYVKDKPVATSYKFDPIRRIVSIRAKDGSRIDFPVSKIRELQNATDKDIQNGYITKAGDAIHWDELDAHYTIAGLAANIFGTKEWMRHLGSIGGSKTSVEKAAAARLNGLRGGRPSLASKESSTNKNISLAASEAVKTSSPEADRDIRFEIMPGKAGQYRFNLRASNGQIILKSEVYSTRDAAFRGIASIKQNARNDKRFERKTAKDGSIYFVFKADDGKPIATSEHFRTKKHLESEINAVAQKAPKAAVWPPTSTQKR